ncbi:hypothetical protein EJB05_40922, partial [Eragrostis curvula]
MPMESQPRAGSERTRLGVYHDVLRRLRDAGATEALAPDFADKLWAHFHRFNFRYAMDVNVDRAEDVLTHMHLLDQATHPENQPAFSVRVVQVPVPTEADAGEPDSSQSNPTEDDGAATPRRLAAHPEPIFGSTQNLKALVRQASSKNLLDDSDALDALLRPMHEITFASNDGPKGLTQLSTLLGKLNLDIKEVHALSTNDGYFLDIFIVVGWDHKETKQLEEALDKEIHSYKPQIPSTSSCWPPELEGKQCGTNTNDNHIDVPKDNSDEWEINFKALKFQDKVASGTYGDLYRGTYFGEDVAIKVLKSDRLNENTENEFAHEVYIMRKIRHKNIVRFLGACTKPKTLCIVTEFMKNGSVYDFLHKRKGCFKLPGLLKAAVDISKGMDYLHKNRIIHRDLKTANLLMDEHEASFLSLIPYEFLTPLQAAIGVVQEGIRPVIPKGTNPKLKKLIEKCWQQNPINRPDFTEILQFLDGIIEEVSMDPSKTHKEKEKGSVFFSFGKGHS